MDHLLQISVRSVLLAAVAAVGLWRVKSATVRHAVWTLVTASMLVQIALGPVLPEIPLRVLTAPVPVAITVTNMVVPDVAVERSPSVWWSWEELAGAIYLCGLFFFSARLVVALRFARELARTSEPTGDGAYESARIAAPLTIGNRILLPMSWRDWDLAKLGAVLAHEQAHVRRRDWAIAAMARVNRCVFWFHPLAWWMERQLARLAEQACDDAALAVVEDRELYARTLLDVARAIQISGRVLSAPMAKEANVETRIDRILDETRRIPKALGRRGWMALALCAAPLVYMASAVQLAPAQTAVMAISPAPAPEPPQTPDVVMMAQATLPAQNPVPTEPPAPPQPQSEVVTIQQVKERLDLEATIHRLQAQLEAAGTVERLAPREGVFETTEFLQQELQRLKAQMQAAQAQTPTLQMVPVPAPLDVSVTSIRVTKISIPLNTPGRHEVSALIRTTEGKMVLSFNELVDHGGALDKNVTLKLGSYRMNVMVRSLSDGSTATQTLNFEVQ